MNSENLFKNFYFNYYENRLREDQGEYKFVNIHDEADKSNASGVMKRKEHSRNSSSVNSNQYKVELQTSNLSSVWQGSSLSHRRLFKTDHGGSIKN